MSRASRAMVESAVLVTLAGIASIVYATTSDGGLWVQRAAVAELEHYHTDAFIPRISAEGVSSLLTRRDPAIILLDVRAEDDYVRGSLPGALNLPYPQIEAGTVPKPSPTQHHTMVITFCSSAHCALARLSARELRRAGWSQVMILEGGVEAWKDAGHPLVQPLVSPLHSSEAGK